MSLIAEALYRLEERAGIVEFDGERSRAEAEALAIGELDADESLPPGVKRQAIRMFLERIDGIRPGA
jgi:hypothetical protein